MTIMNIYVVVDDDDDATEQQDLMVWSVYRTYIHIVVHVYRVRDARRTTRVARRRLTHTYKKKHTHAVMRCGRCCSPACFRSPPPRCCCTEQQQQQQQLAAVILTYPLTCTTYICAPLNTDACAAQQLSACNVQHTSTFVCLFGILLSLCAVCLSLSLTHTLFRYLSVEGYPVQQ